MDGGASVAVACFFIWSVLKEIRDNLIAARLANHPEFIDRQGFRCRYRADGKIECLTLKGFRVFDSESALDIHIAANARAR